MELSFTELDNLHVQKINENNLLDIGNTENSIIKNNNTNIYDYKKISENIIPKSSNSIFKNVQRPKPKTISYDDILSSMNTIVIDGKLEFIPKGIGNNSTNSTLNKNVNQNSSSFKKKVSFNEPQNGKNSYIYDKYFKNYKDPSIPEPIIPRKPLTREEFLKQMILERIHLVNERNRIAQVKSTKLLFNNNNNRNIIINSMQNRNGLNKFFNYK